MNFGLELVVLLAVALAADVTEAPFAAKRFAAMHPKAVSGRPSTPCRGLEQFPMYVINMDSKPTRLSYMERVFGRNITRVSGVAGSDVRTLLDRVALPAACAEKSEQPSCEEQLHADVGRYTGEWFGALPGELGCTVSHLDAMKHAWEDDVPIALIVEDDLGDMLCRHWPTDLTEVVLYANENHPDWYSLRLQFSAGTTEWDAFEQSGWRLVFNRRGDAAADSLPSRKVLADSWGRWTADMGIPFAMPYPDGVGAGATLWSRRGLRWMMLQHMTPPFGGTNATQQAMALNATTDDYLRSALSSPWVPQKWRCTPGFKCVSDLMFFRQAGNHTLVATPVLFSTRLAEDGSLIRALPGQNQNAGSHHLRHLQSTLSASKWLISLLENFHWAAQNHMPSSSGHFIFRVLQRT